MRFVVVIVYGLLFGTLMVVFSVAMIPYRFAYVLSESMEPTLLTNERLLVRTDVDAGFGDIIVFVKDFEDGHGRVLVVKRVVGVAGDQLVSDDTYLTRNGEVIRESIGEFKLVVPNDCFFVVGDNTQRSYDSRYWESPWVGAQDVIGVVIRGKSGLRKVE